ncbi:MAG: hypothetical protein GX594_19180 [Pirellulaceae bacterium]|nr:hypothetical protein [Pirellulaceae bacterium]
MLSICLPCNDRHAAAAAEPVTRVIQPPQPVAFPKIQRVVLEMSCKPFTEMNEQAIRAVCADAFCGWLPLIRHADSVAVMLWVADGSEILDYHGQMDEPIEWGRYIGYPNAKGAASNDKKKKSLHSAAYLYRENPPTITYRDLALIVKTLKQVGGEVTGKPVSVGATFDPGGEFAQSPFKYEKHNEICRGKTMGDGTFVCCYATLNADPSPYAGFPQGIPQGTPFDTFFGRQSQNFLKDLGFDYLWFSNGLGFGLETWSTVGPLFDGKRFDVSKAADIRGKILNFWKAFRAECPDYPIETRGTNFSAGIDAASNAVPLRDIYRSGFNMEPPVNSPWAALNGDFGLELVGFMTRAAELPAGRGFPFRYYIHDPWWLNSPWLDRYEREPHDIYLPLSVGRINAQGEVETPRSISLLTIDDSFGRMPEKVPNEVIPHVLIALEDCPDQPGPTVWVYPFDEQQDMLHERNPRLEEPFFGDWFMRAAINNGFPLNTIVSTRNYLASLEKKPNLYDGVVLVMVVPRVGSPMEAALLRHFASGGRALLYGPADRASDKLLELLNLRLEPPIAGQFTIELRRPLDQLENKGYSDKMQHRETMSAGGCREVLRDPDDSKTQVIALASQESNQRVAALARNLSPGGGIIAWVRGTNSNWYKGGHLLTPDNPTKWFQGDLLMRSALDRLGYRVAVRKSSVAQRNPITTIVRHNNGFFLSGFTPNTNVELRLRFPFGAPLLLGLETELVEGQACYRMPPAWHRECRVFVLQADGEVVCREVTHEADGLTRRMQIEGLMNASVCFFPDTSVPGPVAMQLNSVPPHIHAPLLDYQTQDDSFGRRMTLEHVTSKLLISW